MARLMCGAGPGSGSTCWPAARVAMLACACLTAGTAQAHGQLAGGGFVPALAPHTVRQAPVVGAGYTAWDGPAGVAARADAWFGRLGVAGSLGTASAAGERIRRGDVAVLAELLPQGVGPTRPGVQLQGAYTVSTFAGDMTWSVPVVLGVFLHAPIPLPRRAHVLVQPSLSARHVVAGSGDAEGTSAGVGVRATFTDAGALTLWGLHGHVRLASRGHDRGPRWDVALTRVLRGSGPRGR